MKALETPEKLFLKKQTSPICHCFRLHMFHWHNSPNILPQ
uniref:Uncharacterized protein n=1 Tax=Rhizophora mucronata TaxID=61149 RepID=A0A2P2PM10_RHIMU